VPSEAESSLGFVAGLVDTVAVVLASVFEAELTPKEETISPLLRALDQLV
jgi:hypothetical protein